MREAARRLAAENKRLGGELENTPTWLNEKDKAAAGKGLKAIVRRIGAYIKGARFVRAMARYSVARGALLAGGIAYSAMFAVAGALAIGFTAFSVVLGKDQRLFDSLVGHINTALPGILQTESNPEGLLDPRALIVDHPFNLVTLVSSLVLLWSAITLLGNLRVAIQAMFGIARLPHHFFIDKLLDLSGFLVLFAGVLLSTGVTAFVQLFATYVFDFLHLPSMWGALSLKLVALLVALLVDMCVFIFLFRVMSGARAPIRDLLLGSFIGAVASAIVRFLGTQAVSSVADNPLLAPFAAIVTLLLWVNLIARITLIAAAFTANPPEQLALDPAYFQHADEKPNYVTKSDLSTLAWDYDPFTGVVIAQSDVENEVTIPRWHGLRAGYARLRVARAQRNVRKAENKLSLARARYEAGAIDAYQRRTRPTTDPHASAQRYRPIMHK